MKQVYRLGKRFQNGLKLCYALVLAVVFVFYFIYRAWLGTAFPDFVGTPLACIFLLLGALFVFLVSKGGRWLYNGIWYEVTDESLVYVSGKNRRVYRWTEFQKAELARFQDMLPLPVEFTVAEQKVTLNQSVDSIYDLALQILERIRDTAEIDPKIQSHIELWGDLRGRK